MKISEVEGIIEDQKENVQVDTLKVTLEDSIQDQLRELQKAVRVEVQRDDGLEVDAGVVEDVQQDEPSPVRSAAERVEFVSAVLQLVNDVPVITPADKEIIEKLLQSGQAVPQDPGTQARMDMDRAGERQEQGNQDQAMGELRVKAFAENEELVKQAIQLFAKSGEITPTDVRQNAAELSNALPQQLAEINQQLVQAAPEEVFELRRQRVELAEQVKHYEALVTVLDTVAPLPDQNALTQEDINARAEAVRNEARYAGSPGTAAEGVSESRTGMHFNEYNAAEIGLRMRFDYDPDLGYARSVDWDVGAQVGNLGTRPERFTREETLDDIAAQQASHGDFTHTLAERGHATAQQFSGGDQDIAEELMKMSNVWVMLGRGPEGVNQGAYKEVEDRIVEMRAEYPDDAIHVRVDAVIEGEPQFIVNARGKELVVPDRFEFEITRTPMGGGEPLVERVKVENREDDKP